MGTCCASSSEIFIALFVRLMCALLSGHSRRSLDFATKTRKTFVWCMFILGQACSRLVCCCSLFKVTRLDHVFCFFDARDPKNDILAKSIRNTDNTAAMTHPMIHPKNAMNHPGHRDDPPEGRAMIYPTIPSILAEATRNHPMIDPQLQAMIYQMTYPKLQ